MSVMFGVNISGLVARHIGPGVFDATLISVNKSTRGSDSTGGLTSVETHISGKGFVDDFDKNLIDNTVIKINDVKVNLIADTFTVGINPKPGDKVTIQGETYRVVQQIARDPASAVYTLQCRR